MYIYKLLVAAWLVQQVLDALFARARHFATIGDCDEAFAAYDVILSLKKLSSGKKIDATLERTRVAFFVMVRGGTHFSPVYVISGVCVLIG